MIDDTKIHLVVGTSRKTYKADNSRWPDYFGIELELEGVNWDFNRSGPEGWTTHNDDSLRNGIEFVLASPKGGTLLEQAISNFYSEGIISNSSSRASTHIHINAKDMTISDVRTVTLLMYILEPALFRVIGEGRKHSGYAVSLQEMASNRLKNLMTTNDLANFHSAIRPARNQERYYGLNVASISRHGSLEFRYFPGEPTQGELESWLDFVLAIKRAGAALTVGGIIERVISSKELLELLKEILPEYWYDLIIKNSSEEELITQFNEIASVCERSDRMSHREPVVTISKALINRVIKRHNSNKKVTEYLLALHNDLHHVTESEWQYHLGILHTLSRGGVTVSTDDEIISREELRRMTTRSFTRFNIEEIVPYAQSVRNPSETES